MASSVEVQEKRAELRRLVEEVNSDWDWKKVQRAQYLSAWFKENGISVEEEQNTAAIVDSKSSRTETIQSFPEVLPPIAVRELPPLPGLSQRRSLPEKKGSNSVVPENKQPKPVASEREVNLITPQRPVNLTASAEQKFKATSKTEEIPQRPAVPVPKAGPKEQNSAPAPQKPKTSASPLQEATPVGRKPSAEKKGGDEQKVTTCLSNILKL